MDEYVAYASSLPPSGQLPTLTFIALILGLGKGGVPGLGEIILLYIYELVTEFCAHDMLTILYKTIQPP